MPIKLHKPIEYAKDYMPGLFLAGSISNAWDWQDYMSQMLAEHIVKRTIDVYNPRRENFNLLDPQQSTDQINWEHFHLNKAVWISFWFSHETLAPITLYELGRWIGTTKQIFVGCDPSYARKFDVYTQMQIARPELEVVYNIEQLTQQVVTALEGPK